MPAVLFQVLAESLVLINKLVPDEALRIQKRLNDYKRRWDEEYAKGSQRDDAMLAMLDRELQYTSQLFLAAVRSAQSKN